MPITLKGDYEKVLKEALASASKKRAEIGIKDAGVAEYATYVEYGWVQAVTPKQSRYFGANYGIGLKVGSQLFNPPRPFMRGTLAAKQDDWVKMFSFYAKQAGANQLDKALALTAELMANDIKMTIRNGAVEGGETFPRRSAFTMALLEAQTAFTKSGRRRKTDATGNAMTDKPMMNTGVMLSKVGYWLT